MRLFRMAEEPCGSFCSFGDGRPPIQPFGDGDRFYRLVTVTVFTVW
jgi:hypothetical protein